MSHKFRYPRGTFARSGHHALDTNQASADCPEKRDDGNMIPKSLLIANRAEIAIRIMRAAAELGIRTVAVFSDDDARSLHTRKADEARRLNGVGAAAYLDAEQIIEVAKQAGCDEIHPGYGFLSEKADFARQCADEGIMFVGPC